MTYNYYEDYMREVLGYNGRPHNCNTCYNITNNMPGGIQVTQSLTTDNTSKLKYMYPKVYNLINPIVCKMCDENTEEITENLLTKMTEEIYNTVVSNIEAENIVNINIVTKEENTRASNVNSVSKRRPQNQLLRDLIRILILNRLINQNRPPMRPPMPPARPYI